MTSWSESALADDEISARARNWSEDLQAALAGLYPWRAPELHDVLLARAARAARARSADLVRLDRDREKAPDWFLHAHHVGYACYAEQFGGTLKGVEAKVPYLRELGVDLLHLMSVLRPRDGENDGGFAIDDYLSPGPRLGTVADLEHLIASLRAAGVSTCLDLVMNHTSADHEWAVKARSGSAYHRALYLTFSDRALPDAYEATLPEVFPTMAPGNFTWSAEMGAWVWTTFREFQWDLNWANPDVFLEMTDVLLYLANLGVELVRLDAVAFTWKRMGTNCQNQPEAHLIAQALRAVLGVAAPACALLAEAIVGPDELVPYLGAHERQRRECQLAYHNQLMVQCWSMLASRETGLANVALRRLPAPPPGTTWLTYARCHDDIGWAIADADAAAVGLEGAAHRRFLARFYRGDFPMSFARGAAFSANTTTGDERTSGMASSLSGIAAGLEAGDPGQLELGTRRLLLVYAIAFGFGGVPMVYMGDEVGLGDDRTYEHDPSRAHDSRWRHRPRFDEEQAAERHVPGTVAASVWAGFLRLAEARRSCGALHGSGTTEVLEAGTPGVFAWARRHPRYGTLLGLANVTERAAHASPGLMGVLDATPVVDLLDPLAEDLLDLGPLVVRWLTADRSFRTAPAVPGLTELPCR